MSFEGIIQILAEIRDFFLSGLEVVGMEKMPVLHPTMLKRMD